MFVAFLDLEKVYDHVDREDLWKMFQVYVVGGKFLNDIKRFYVNSKACLRIRGERSDLFKIERGLR